MPVTLDPDAAAIYKAFQEAGRPAYETLTAPEAREYYRNARVVMNPEPPALESNKPLSIPAPHGAIDRVVGHVAGLSVQNGFAQTRVGIRVTATRARRHGNFLDEFGEEFAALGVSCTLLVLNRVPLRMSGHLSLLILKRDFDV